MSTNEFMSMKELGTLFGVTSHKIGRRLKELDLRNDKGRPTRKAFELGLMEQRYSQSRLDIYSWVWHGDKTAALLEQAGMERVANVPANE